MMRPMPRHQQVEALWNPTDRREFEFGAAFAAAAGTVIGVGTTLGVGITVGGVGITVGDGTITNAVGSTFANASGKVLTR